MWALSSASSPRGHGLHHGAAPWYDPAAARIARLRVCERATMRLSVVTSVPFLANMAQSAWGTVATNSSPSSTSTGPGPLRQSPWRRCASAAASTTGW